MLMREKCLKYVNLHVELNAKFGFNGVLYRFSEVKNLGTGSIAVVDKYQSLVGMNAAITNPFAFPSALLN